MTDHAGNLGYFHHHSARRMVTTYSNETNHVKEKIELMIRFISKLIDNRKNMVDIAKNPIGHYFFDRAKRLRIKIYKQIQLSIR